MQAGIDVLQIPFKALTLKPLSQYNPFRYISVRFLQEPIKIRHQDKVSRLLTEIYVETTTSQDHMHYL